VMSLVVDYFSKSMIINMTLFNSWNWLVGGKKMALNIGLQSIRWVSFIYYNKNRF
jgi:hypothetical protein